MSATAGEGELDRGFLTRIGARVRALRTAQGRTVQQLADRAGISRRLLTQIELGQANPSLVTVTRIARQLGTEFTSLLDTGHLDSPIERHEAGAHVLVWSRPAGSSAHLLEAASPSRAADLWLWRLLPSDVYHGQADPVGSQELFYVLTGALTLVAGEDQVVIPARASGRLRSDRLYSYRNDGGVPVEFLRTVALS